MSTRSKVRSRFNGWRSVGWLVLLFTLGMVPEPTPLASAIAPPPRLALLVGVSQYPQTGKYAWRPLNTHQEIAALSKVLIERHGFAKADVLTLEDAQASGPAIREAFARHLISRAKRGAVIFFHFSGHGQQVIDRSGDELDALDESIVPGDATDQRAAAGEKSNILDDELAGWLTQLGQRMRSPAGRVEGSIVLSFDSCFSGTITRGDLVERGRAWDETLDGRQPGGRSGAASKVSAPLLDLDARDYMLLTATHSDQTAKERDGMGVYSRALVAALTRLPKEVSYRSLLHEVTVEVRKSVTNQTPDLEGNPDRLLFGSLVAQPGIPYLSLLDVRGDKLTLSAGTLHLVSLGSVYALHRAGEAPMGPGTLLVEAEVIAAGPTTSVLRLRPQAGRVADVELRRARVVEKEHSYTESPRLRVRCLQEGGGPCPAPLHEALGRIEEVQRLAGDHKAAATGSADYDLKLRVKAGVAELYRPDSGTAVASVSLRAAPGATEPALAARLRAEWRWQRLFRLRGHSPLVQVQLRLVPVKGERNSSGLVVGIPQPLRQQAGTSIRLPEGALYQLELTNPSSAPLWVTVLELGPDGSIQPLFPQASRPGEGSIAAGTAARIVPMPYVFETTGPPGTYTLKVIATTERVDFSQLAQEAAQLTPQTVGERGGELERLAAGHPLGALLVAALSGNLVRSRLAPVEMGTWSVDDVLLEVVSK